MLKISNLKIPLFITYVFLISPALEVSHIHGITFTAAHWAGSWLRFEGSDLVMSQCVEHNGNGMSIIFDTLFIATLATSLSFHSFIFLTWNVVYLTLIDKIQLAADWQSWSLSGGLLQTSEATSAALPPIVMCQEQEEEAEAGWMTEISRMNGFMSVYVSMR